MGIRRLIFLVIFSSLIFFSCSAYEWQKRNDKDEKSQYVENENYSLAQVVLNLLPRGAVNNAESRNEIIGRSCNSLQYKIGISKRVKLNGIVEMLNNGIPQITFFIAYYYQDFCRKTVPICKQLFERFFESNNSLNYNKVLLNPVSSFASLKRFLLVKLCLNKCLIPRCQLNNLLKTDQVFCVANVFFNKDYFDKSEMFFKNANKFYKRNNESIGRDNLINFFGRLYSEIRKTNKVNGADIKAVVYLKKAGELAFLKGFFDNIYNEYTKNRKYNSYFAFKKLYSYLRHVVFSKKITRFLIELNASYNNEKLQKEALLISKKHDKEKNENKSHLIVIFSLGALLIISVLLGQLFRQRFISNKLLAIKNEELHKQKLDEMQGKIKLQRMSALMESQEQERTRAATELHDGLGSLLSTIKHHFEVLECKMETKIEIFGKTQNLLDEACMEVRRLSQDMTSNVLARFGLAAAIQDMAEMVSSSGNIKVKVFISGITNQFESSKEINLFRIAQELMGNIIKHSKANMVNFQLTQHEDVINMIVEDNGIGFDYIKGKEKGGMGLRNLNARVEHIRGSIDFDTGKGKGTTVIVEIPINENNI